MNGFRCFLMTFLVALLATQNGFAADIVSYASVQDDSTLKIRGRTIRLFGIYIPPTNRFCRRSIRPVKCASRAALALDFKIQGFVHCKPKWKNKDRSITAICYVGRSYHSEGEDLSAYLLTQGWATALPDAPYEYRVLEDIARHNDRGVWGFQVDRIQR